jgi:uncharacterized membrane protein YvbJ
MVKCPKCGKEVDAATFCSNCGFKLSSQSEKIKEKFCANCGSKMNKDATFCSKCGADELISNKVGNNLVPTFNPGTAFLISIYTTGAGHIYLGLFKKGLSFLITQILLIVVVIILAIGSSTTHSPLPFIIIILGILAFLGLHIYSIYDAYKSIKKITNRETVEDNLFFEDF